jgi:polysaccharide export outer membrane protein
MDRHARVRAALAALLLCLLACRSAPYVWVHQLPPEPAPSGGRTTIGPGDLVEVLVYGEEGASTKGNVLADGTLTMPLLGPVYVVGKKPEELAKSLEEQLKRYIQVPSVTVIIHESRISLAVIGEVRQPGVVLLTTPATVLQALAAAGGMTEFADSSGIFVLRTDSKTAQTQRIRFSYSALVEAEPAASRFHLRTGDVLVVE